MKPTELTPITAKTLDPDGDGQAEPTKAYTTRKTVAQGALDFALLMANASQLKALVEVPANSRSTFHLGLLLLLALSIALQVAAGIILLLLGMMDPKGKKETRRVEWLNNVSVCLILLITVVNIFIASFGISYVDDAPDNAP
ncbi:hypothetical protein ACOMHN_055929 [Nucella lapillus]